MSIIRTRIVSALLVVGVAAPASAHAVHERRQQLQAEHELAELTAAVAPTPMPVQPGGRRITLNGAPVRVRISTEARPLADAMKAIDKECASGDESVALARDEGSNEGARKPIRLERVASEEGGAGVRASLCIFADDGPASDEPLRRVRYTVGHQLDDGRTALTTIVNESRTPLAALFPADGDSPGSDLPGVPRPAQTRRLLTAAMDDGDYSVRMYASSLSVASAMSRYDEAMSTAGFVTTGTLPTARMYRRDGRSYMASFSETTTGSVIALAPFEGQAGSSRIQGRL
jgi:hypothetical protein